MNDSEQEHKGVVAGFSVYKVTSEETCDHYSFYLPSRLAHTLTEEQRAAKAAKQAEEIRKYESQDASTSRTPSALRSSPGGSELDPIVEARALSLAAVRDKQDATKEVAAYDVLEPVKLIKDLKVRTPDKEIHRRNETLYKQLKSKGHIRSLARPTVDLAELEDMRRSFPHFSAVLDLVRDQFAFSESTGKPFLLPPLLLGGEPGIGKTRFSQDLASALGTVMRRLPFDNDQTGSVLLGSDRHWANTAYGVVFEMVVLGVYANPVILLDEIDKASRWRDANPLASLHSLLEPVTSQRVRDLSLDFEFNASRVIWIATGNDLTRIPDSLRSRFTEFTIKQPNGEQALQMAESVAQEVHVEMNLAGFEHPAREIVRFIAHLSAREQIQALKRAYATANAAGRNRLTLRDLPEQVLNEAREFTGDDAPPAGWLH